MNKDDLIALLSDLRAHEREGAYYEFKTNNDDRETIGQLISGLSNTAALHEQDEAYLIYGIADNGDIVGTKVDLYKKHKNQEMINWVATLLQPEINFEVHEIMVDGKRVVVVIIAPASGYVVTFKKQAYIRVGTYNKPLKEHPGKEKALWDKLNSQSFEYQPACLVKNVSEIKKHLDIDRFFELIKLDLPETEDGIIDTLLSNKLLRRSKGKLHITNLGAILFAKNISDFDHLDNKGIRLVQYSGSNRVNAVNEVEGSKGYAIGLEGLINYIMGLLPANEELSKVIRTKRKLYPIKSVRELVVNSIIHQDFQAKGTSPIIEIFDNRIEIRNPGTPLIPTNRFLDAPPRSRNEKLSKTMRRFGFCEERGSGIDRVVTECEIYQLPPPDFIGKSDHTTAILFAPAKLSQMNKEDKIRATYQHACLKFVSNDRMTNASLRERFGIEESNYPQASKIIKAAMDAGAIKKSEKSDREYIPFWA